MLTLLYSVCSVGGGCWDINSKLQTANLLIGSQTGIAVTAMVLNILQTTDNEGNPETEDTPNEDQDPHNHTVANKVSERYKEGEKRT